MMTLGTLFGIWFGDAAQAWFPHAGIHPSVFAVAGMGALFAATVRAPLTGIALAVEMTGNYFLILPLILTCMAATVVAEAFGGKPIYSVLLKRTLEREKRTSGAV
jgi:CIC family chloride channel protein